MKKVLFVLALSAVAQAAGFIGQPTPSPVQWPLCQEYGCTQLAHYSEDTEILGRLSTVVYQLKSTDTKAKLTSFADGTVQGFELLVRHTPPSMEDIKIMSRAVQLATGNTYPDEAFNKCFASLDINRAIKEDTSIRKMRAAGQVTEIALNPAIGEDKASVATLEEISAICWIRPYKNYGIEGIRIFVGD